MTERLPTAPRAGAWADNLDTNEIIAIRELGMEPVIPPKSNRGTMCTSCGTSGERIPGIQAVARGGDRYAKRTASYLAICQLRAVMIWSKLF